MSTAKLGLLWKVGFEERLQGGEALWWISLPLRGAERPDSWVGAGLDSSAFLSLLLEDTSSLSSASFSVNLMENGN